MDFVKILIDECVGCNQRLKRTAIIEPTPIVEQALVIARAKFPHMDDESIVRAVCKGYTERPYCKTEGCDHYTAFTSKGFTELCHPMCRAELLGYDLDVDHCLACGKATKHSPFCGKSCARHFRERVLPYVDGIKRDVESGLDDKELFIKHGFSGNYVLRKYLLTESVSRVLGTRAFINVMEATLAQYGVNDSPAVWAYVNDMGERPECACDGCPNHVYFPRAPSTTWRGKYCSRECAGKETPTAARNSRVNQTTLDILDDKEKLLALFLENGSSITKTAEHLDVNDSCLGKYINRYGFKTNKWSRPVGELKVSEYLSNIHHLENYRPAWLTPTESNRRCELDFFIPDVNVAIEVNGDYWHSERYKDKDFHLNKFTLCKEHGVHLIQLFQSDFNSKEAYWEAYIKSLGSVVSVAARRTDVKRLSKVEEGSFFRDNHPQGHIGSSVCYGLYENGVLVMAASYSKPRFADYQWELLRMATKIGVRVVGGASKLLTAFKREFYPDNIVSYCDHCYGDGRVYGKLGFEYVHTTLNYYWFHPRTRTVLTRYQVTKKDVVKMLGELYDYTLSVEDNLRASKWYKVFKAGNSTYVWKPIA